MHVVKIIIASFLLITTASGQTPQIDSLKNLLGKSVRIDTIRVNLLNELAYEIRTNDRLKAQEYAVQAGELSLRLGYPKGKAASLWIIGITTLYNDKKGALENFRKALVIANETGDKTAQCNYLIAIGNGEKLVGETAASDAAYKQALQTAQEIADNRLIIKAKTGVAGNCIRSGNYIKAVRSLHEVVELAKEIGDNEMVARAYANLGLIYNLQGNYPKALEYYLSALSLNEERNDYVGMHDCLSSIASIQSDHDDFDEALETTNKALQLSIQQKDSMRLSLSYHMLGNIYRRMNRPQALEYYQKSLSMSKFNKIAQDVNNLLAIGSIYIENGEFHKAMSRLDEALVLTRKPGMKRLSGEVYVRKGIAYVGQKKYGQAKEYIQKALVVAEETASISIQQECHRLMSEIYAATGNFRGAYVSQIQYKLLSDSLFNEKNTKRIAMLEISYQFDKERDVYELEKSSGELRIKNQQQTILSLVLISVLVILLSFALYWFGRLKKRVMRLEIENMNHELEANQKAMAVATLKLVQNSERDTQTVRMLEDIDKDTVGAGHINLNSLINHYKHQFNNSNWEEFETLFTKVNSSFWDKLNALCPTLTPNERKLCVFLKLNMSNKDIALITFQSEDALKKSRLRLRKKFSLDRSINLSAFIQNM